MYFRRFLNITILLFVMLILNSCAAVNAPLNAVSSVINATNKVATTGVRTAGAVIGAPITLMQ